MADARIDFFDGTEFDFLSNFHRCGAIPYMGERWDTTEHAFQAAKTLDRKHRFRVLAARSPGLAKSLGQRAAFEKHKVSVLPDWERVKHHVMMDLLRIKFSYADVQRRLLDTDDRELVEGNAWNDTCWGVVMLKDGPTGERVLGVGENHLGRKLMRVRAELRPKVKQLWHVTAIDVGGRYLKTAECSTLAAAVKAADHLGRSADGTDDLFEDARGLLPTASVLKYQNFWAGRSVMGAELTVERVK